MAIWDDVISKEEREAYEKANWGGKIGFGERPALVIVDMCKGFVEPEYPFSSPPAMPATKQIKKVLELSREKNVPVFYTTNAKINNRAQLGYWKVEAMLDPVMAEGDGREIHPLIAPEGDEIVIEKYYPSAFFGTNFASLLTYHRVDTLIVTGTVTSGCVRATVLDGFNHNYRVMIPQECVCDRGEVSHKVALFELHMKYADVIPTQEVLDYLKTLKD